MQAREGRSSHHTRVTVNAKYAVTAGLEDGGSEAVFGI